MDTVHTELRAEGGVGGTMHNADPIFPVAIVMNIRGKMFPFVPKAGGHIHIPEAASASSSLDLKQPDGNCCLTSLHLSVMPNSFCDQSQGTIGLALTWILLSIGTLTVSLRIYVRSDVSRKIGWDDYTAIASLVSTTYALRLPLSERRPRL